MLAYRYPLIAREGWLWITPTILLALLLQLTAGWLAVPLWLLAIVLLFLFRDPARRVPAAPLGVVSPVDGRVTRIAPVYDGYAKRPAICVSIEMGLTGVYSVRSPMEGKVVEQWFAAPRRIGDNEHQIFTSGKTFVQWIQSDAADDVVLVMDLTLRRRTPRCYAHSGERIGQGQRCGYIRFGGATVEILLPANARVGVQEGDEVQAGSDILATLLHDRITPPKTVAG